METKSMHTGKRKTLLGLQAPLQPQFCGIFLMEKTLWKRGCYEKNQTNLQNHTGGFTVFFKSILISLQSCRVVWQHSTVVQKPLMWLKRWSSQSMAE